MDDTDAPREKTFLLARHEARVLDGSHAAFRRA